MFFYILNNTQSDQVTKERVVLRDKSNALPYLKGGHQKVKATSGKIKATSGKVTAQNAKVNTVIPHMYI